MSLCFWQWVEVNSHQRLVVDTQASSTLPLMLIDFYASRLLLAELLWR